MISIRRDFCHFTPRVLVVVEAGLNVSGPGVCLDGCILRPGPEACKDSTSARLDITTFVIEAVCPSVLGAEQHMGYEQFENRPAGTNLASPSPAMVGCGCWCGGCRCARYSSCMLRHRRASGILEIRVYTSRVRPLKLGNESPRDSHDVLPHQISWYRDRAHAIWLARDRAKQSALDGKPDRR